MTPMTQEAANERTSTRHRILQIALTLMSEKGVDATSMRDLASAAGLNVASLYHYFPSKRELLEAVLIERGFLPIQSSYVDGEFPEERSPDDEEPTGETLLADMLALILVNMFEVREFVRLMLGEAIRYEETARAVGLDLFMPFQISIEEWILKHRPDLAERSGAESVARLLSAVVIGIFVSQEAGVLTSEGDDFEAMLTSRARETAQIIGAAFLP
jgi:TetR/AcrR family transcriptional regulator, cholesterol catabolism regulator